MALMALVLRGWSSVTILDEIGWFETAALTWRCDEPADRFVVTCSGEGLQDAPVDDALIRDYGDFFRVDVPGLRAGTYRLTVTPIFEGRAGPSVDSNAIDVLPHDRSGFAFWPLACPPDPNRWSDPPGGDVNAVWDALTPGAYRHDGRPKAGAVVVYITEQTKDTVELEVAGANSNPCVGLQAILDGFKKGRDTRPLVVRLIGRITDPAVTNKGDLVVENRNNPASFITIEGVGNDATVDGWGLRLKNASNVEIRNLGFMNCDSQEGDSLGLQQNNEHIWIHHCDFFYGLPGGDADQAKGDGALDCKRSTNVTVSYNHFWDTGKTHLLGLGEGGPGGLYASYHHNWYDHGDSRHPRVRYYSVHVYNNYYDGIAKYGVGATEGASVFVEANVFRHCRYPMLISMQGSDVYDPATGRNDDDRATFSREDGGIIKAFGNLMTGMQRFVAYGDPAYPGSTIDFDACVVAERCQPVPDVVRTAQGGHVYNNFDSDPDILRPAAVDPAREVVERVTRSAGRCQGGDFRWDFDDAVDDGRAEVDEPLRQALAAYRGRLVAVQGQALPDDSGAGDPDPVVTGDLVHNFTVSGLQSDWLQITGNLSTSKGTVTYEGLTLTRCLKVESSTVIRFTTDRVTELTLVFNESFSGAVRIDGVIAQAEGGILRTTLSAGDHRVTKQDVANLYLVILNATGR